MKKIIITGSSSGIGLNAANKLYQLGHDIIGIDTNINKELPSEIKQYKCNLLSEKSLSSIFLEIGYFDVAINCAGILGDRKRLKDFSRDEFLDNFNSIFFPTFNAMKEELKLIDNLKGHDKIFKIINIASITAQYGTKNTAAYSVAKAAIVNLTKVAAIEHAPYAHINSISPATIDTPMIRKKHQNNWPDYSKAYLTGDCGKADDVFYAINMMIENNFMTGYDLIIDGGYGAPFNLQIN